MTEADIRRRIVIRGVVQGVFFRDCTRAEAERHGVAGWVRNCADGSVEAVFEGAPDGVRALVGFCRHGPPRAEVRETDVREEPPEGLRGFSVR